MVPLATPAAFAISSTDVFLKPHRANAFAASTRMHSFFASSIVLTELRIRSLLSSGRMPRLGQAPGRIRAHGAEAVEVRDPSGAADPSTAVRGRSGFRDAVGLS